MKHWRNYLTDGIAADSLIVNGARPTCQRGYNEGLSVPAGARRGPRSATCQAVRRQGWCWRDLSQPSNLLILDMSRPTISTWKTLDLLQEVCHVLSR